MSTKKPQQKVAKRIAVAGDDKQQQQNSDRVTLSEIKIDDGDQLEKLTPSSSVQASTIYNLSDNIFKNCTFKYIDDTCDDDDEDDDDDGVDDDDSGRDNRDGEVVDSSLKSSFNKTDQKLPSSSSSLKSSPSNLIEINKAATNNFIKNNDDVILLRNTLSSVNKNEQNSLQKINIINVVGQNVMQQPRASSSSLSSAAVKTTFTTIPTTTSSKKLLSPSTDSSSISISLRDSAAANNNNNTNNKNNNINNNSNNTNNNNNKYTNKIIHDGELLQSVNNRNITKIEDNTDNVIVGSVGSGFISDGGDGVDGIDCVSNVNGARIISGKPVTTMNNCHNGNRPQQLLQTTIFLTDTEKQNASNGAGENKSLTMNEKSTTVTNIITTAAATATTTAAGAADIDANVGAHAADDVDIDNSRRNVDISSGNGSNGNSGNTFVDGAKMSKKKIDFSEMKSERTKVNLHNNNSNSNSNSNNNNNKEMGGDGAGAGDVDDAKSNNCCDVNDVCNNDTSSKPSRRRIDVLNNNNICSSVGSSNSNNINSSCNNNNSVHCDNKKIENLQNSKEIIMLQNDNKKLCGGVTNINKNCGANDKKNNMKPCHSGGKCSSSKSNNIMNDDELNLVDCKDSTINMNSAAADPYAELEFYLENVKREISDHFEQFKLNEKKLYDDKFVLSSELKKNQQLITKSLMNKATTNTLMNDAGNNSCCNVKQLSPLATGGGGGAGQNEEAIKTAEWAKNILKELDQLMTTNPKTNINNNDSNTNFNKNKSTNDNSSNLLKPKKRNYIPLKSFKLEQSQSNSSDKKTTPSSNFTSFTLPCGKIENFPILKIEEDDKQQQQHRNNLLVRTISTGTQTNSPSNKTSDSLFNNNRKQMTEDGSTLTIWTSDESILRSGCTVDEDNKSSSSSACEEASGVLSSGKSGNSLNSSELDNDNTESGIGTATPPKEQDNLWRTHRKNHLNPLTLGSPTEKHAWVRTESVMTQTSPITTTPANDTNSFFKYNCSDDPDLLEVLSLYEGADNEIYNDDDENGDGGVGGQVDDQYQDDGYDYVNDLAESNKLLIVNRKNFDNNEDDDDNETKVVLRNHNNNTSNLSTSFSNNNNNNNVLNNNNKKYGRRTIMGCSPVNVNKLVHRDGYGSYDMKPFGLAIQNEPFQQNIIELPSPSSASLHSGQHEQVVMQELSTKSNSAPILLKKEKRGCDDFSRQKILRYSRSQSDRHLAEIEAIEACKWLRAAGFPQYAQMYEDLQFPIDLSNVAKDHPFLENDPLQSLYRRLVALNRCATMRLDSAHKTGNVKDDSEEEEYALSENWTFEQKNRRWSRVGEMGTEIPPNLFDKCDKSLVSSRDSSTDKLDKSYSGGSRGGGGGGGSRDGGGCDDDDSSSNYGYSTLPMGMSFQQNESDSLPVRFRRTGSERLKDGAKAFLRRVESIKSRRRKRQNRDGVIISGPQELDLTQIGHDHQHHFKDTSQMGRSQPPSPMPTSPFVTSCSTKIIPPTINKSLSTTTSPPTMLTTTITTATTMSNLDYTRPTNQHRLSPMHYSAEPTLHHKIYQTSYSTRTSPLHFFSTSNNHSSSILSPNIVIDTRSGDDSTSYFSDASQESSSCGGGGGALNLGVPKKRPSRTRRFLQKGSKVEDIGAMSDSECHQIITRNQKFFNESSSSRSGGSRVDVDNTPPAGLSGSTLSPATAELLKPSKGLNRGGSLNLGKDSQRYRDGFKTRSFRSRSSCRKSDEDKIKAHGVIRWHSFQSQDRPDSLFKKCFTGRSSEEIDGVPLAAMSCGQIQVIRKLALVTLTGYMERYCPTHRSGWNWDLPKFIKKIKAPDYKDKKVFGVPFLLLLQRSGETLPKAIQAAIKWLKLNAMDQTGIFRKSGVKSRIAKLKSFVEESPVEDTIPVYDSQQAYDVADMVKQYFRELPDMLLTAKMSETFVAIFLHLPPEVRPDAVQSAVLLLPDEHREVLQHLLEFLSNVAENAVYNQMTANNLAVCLAPSLFHGSVASLRTTNLASPRRRKPTGVPDPRELSETRASHECLTYLIENCRKVFTISNEKIARCNFGYMEESRPVPLEALGEGLPVHDWRGYLYECTSATIKEGREKSRGWISMSSFDTSVEIAYKKVGDGHPLRLWRVLTEVDAPPMEVLHFIFKERHQWDHHLLKWRIIEQLDERSEIFQYAAGGQVITDYCVLRSWRSDLPRGACVIVETSIEHPQAKLLLGGVRGVVLASRYLIEPSGNGKSKIMHLSRVDIKGKTPEWYNKSYGHICSHNLAKIRNAFKHISENSDIKI